MDSNGRTTNSLGLVHEGRIRPIFSGNGGVRISIASEYPSLRFGLERIYYRGNEIDRVLLGLAYGF